MKIHKVKSGDSLYNIAKVNETEVHNIMDDNQLSGNDKLAIGESLIIRNEGKRRIDVNGYVYPFIDNDTLYASIPFLTYISIFSYHATNEGNLIPLNDIAIIEMAEAGNVAPMLVVTNMSSSGFDSNIAHSILISDDIQNKLINNILEVLKEKHYYGVSIDFEYVYPEDKELYNNFIKKIADILHYNNYELMTALAPKVYAEQKGLLYEAHDYGFHGKYADHVILMTYEWGYTYGPPMAVAPLNQVERVINYAVSEIPSKKILMGIPNYGYDWTLPYTKGVAAKSISNTAAVELAKRKNVSIEFDNIANAPFFHYVDEDGKEHEVWFEDARSIEAKLSLVSKYDLGGVSYWHLGKMFNSNFLVLEDMYRINKK